MAVTPQMRLVLKRLKAYERALKLRKDRNWLATEYRKCLFGGWRHPDGRWIDRRHDAAIEFHEACKVPDYQVFLIAGGNRSGKSFSGLSEFCAWIQGERPWDGTVTSGKGGGRRWILAGQSFSEAFPSTLNPYFEQRMGWEATGGWIRDVQKDQRKNVIRYYLKNGDVVHCLSYQQYSKADKQAGNPFEGSAWFGAYFDEPPPYEVWVATQRGLVTGKSSGWGKAIIAATVLNHPWLLHEIYSEAHNMGGSKKDVFATHFTIYDNPYNTQEAIDRYASDMSDELRQVRLYGRPRFLSGRVFQEWDEDVHVFSETEFDVLNMTFSDGGPASTAPIVMAADPHHRRPWAMVWIAVLPNQEFYIVRQWPAGSGYNKIRNCSMGFDDYAEAIREVEATIPGGSARVLWRELDPNLGRAPGAAQGRGSTTMQKEMRARGFFFRTDVNDKQEHGHEIIHSLLQWDGGLEDLSEINRPRLYVSAECANVVYSFQNYCWDDYTDESKGLKPTVKDDGKDFMDAVRYAIARAPRFRAWEALSDWYTTGVTRHMVKSKMARVR